MIDGQTFGGGVTIRLARPSKDSRAFARGRLATEAGTFFKSNFEPFGLFGAGILEFAGLRPRGAWQLKAPTFDDGWPDVRRRHDTRHAPMRRLAGFAPPPKGGEFWFAPIRARAPPGAKSRDFSFLRATFHARSGSPRVVGPLKHCIVRDEAPP